MKYVLEMSQVKIRGTAGFESHTSAREQDVLSDQG